MSYLCIAGPTASGKTAAALAVAEAFSNTQAIEIISVDSGAVYRGMDIGTAKPSSAERAQVPHHLIDILDAAQIYSAALFATNAKRAIGEINARGNLPLLVGGTMLYFKTLFEGLDAMPAADAAVRAELEVQAERDGPGALYTELERVDATTAARLSYGDTQRIRRALEVFRVSGKPLSAYHTRKARTPWPLIALEPRDRSWLRERINVRFAKMLADGLIDEVRALRSRPDLHESLPAMRCVGYRQTWEALERDELATLAERGSAATRQLAKRQLTWLRGMSERHTVVCDAPDATAQVVEKTKFLLETLRSN